MNGQQNDHLNRIGHPVTDSSIHTAASRFIHTTQNQMLLKHPLRNPHHPLMTYYNTDYGNYLPTDYGRSKSYKPKALY
jgi:23S rRNA maturation-related 3'-5' exoribonuclease YhaM